MKLDQWSVGRSQPRVGIAVHRLYLSGMKSFENRVSCVPFDFSIDEFRSYDV